MANTANIINELRSVLSAPLYQQLLSPAAIGKLKAVIERPFSSGTPFRVKANQISSYFANVSKAYHSGKGDDFESVAVVFGNPYLPVSLSDAGLVSNKNDTSSVIVTEVTTNTNNSGNEVTRKKTVSIARSGSELWEAMRDNGGHYITVNLDIDDLLTSTAKNARDLKNKGKGKQRVQIDYLIIQKGNPDKIYILELKAGATHIVMDQKEEEQMSKAAWVFRKWYKDASLPIPDVQLLYHPFLSDKLPDIIPGHTSEKVTYLTLKGLCQFLSLDPTLVKRLGSMRAEYRKNMATFESRLSGALFSTRNRLIANRQAQLNQAALREAAEDQIEEALNKSNILSGNASRAVGQNVSKIFGNKLSAPNVAMNSDWKQVVQYITYLIARKRNLESRPKNQAVQKEIYDIVRSILKLNSNRGGRILNPEARTQFNTFVRDASKVFMNTTGNVNHDFKEAYIIEYIKLRPKVLGNKRVTNLGAIPNGAFRRPTKIESAAALKAVNKTASNANIVSKYQRLKNIHMLRPNNRGLAAKGFAASNINRVKRESTSTRVNFVRSLRTTNNVNKLAQNTKNTLGAQMAEIDGLLNWLVNWSTDILQPGSITNRNKADILKTITAARAKVNSELKEVNVARSAVRPKIPKLSKTAQEAAERLAAQQIAAAGLAPQQGPPLNNVGGFNQQMNLNTVQPSGKRTRTNY
jgi:hypothetical protein